MASNHSPDPISYESSVFQAGLHTAKPPFSFHPSEWESQAKDILSANSWGYTHGDAGTGSTYRKNLTAFERWSIVPRRLCASRKDPGTGEEAFADTRTTVLGQELPFPIAMAPIGVQKIFNPQGEVAAARAAAVLGIPYTLSTASSPSIEDVAAAMDDVSEAPTPTPRWFQLYWPSRRHDDITASLLSRAKKAGYTALFVTLDTYVLGWRPADMNHGYNPFLHPDRIGVEIGLTDPVFQRQFQAEHGYEIAEAARHDSELTGHDLGEAAGEWAKIIDCIPGAFPRVEGRGISAGTLERANRTQGHTECGGREASGRGGRPGDRGFKSWRTAAGWWGEQPGDAAADCGGGGCQD